MEYCTSTIISVQIIHRLQHHSTLSYRCIRYTGMNITTYCTISLYSTLYRIVYLYENTIVYYSSTYRCICTVQVGNTCTTCTVGTTIVSVLNRTNRVHIQWVNMIVTIMVLQWYSVPTVQVFIDYSIEYCTVVQYFNTFNINTYWGSLSRHQWHRLYSTCTYCTPRVQYSTCRCTVWIRYCMWWWFTVQ